MATSLPTSIFSTLFFFILFSKVAAVLHAAPQTLASTRLWPRAEPRWSVQKVTARTRIPLLLPLPPNWHVQGVLCNRAQEGEEEEGEEGGLIDCRSRLDDVTAAMAARSDGLSRSVFGFCFPFFCCFQPFRSPRARRYRFQGAWRKVGCGYESGYTASRTNRCAYI